MNHCIFLQSQALNVVNIAHLNDQQVAELQAKNSHFSLAESERKHKNGERVPALEDLKVSPQQPHDSEDCPWKKSFNNCSYSDCSQ